MECSRLGNMLNLEIQKWKHAIKIAQFQQHIGGNAACTKRLMRDTKGCRQLMSNFIYFSDSWLSGVKTTEGEIAEGVDDCSVVKKILKDF